MQKKYKLFCLAYLIIMVILLLTIDDYRILSMGLEYVRCGTANGIPRPIPQLTTIGYTLLITGTPLVLIVFTITTLIKAISGGNADEIVKVKNKVAKKFMTAAIIFLIASIAQFVVTRVASNSEDKASITSCLQCFLYFSEGHCPVSDTGNGVTEQTYRPTSSSSIVNSLVASADGKFMWPLPSPYDKSHITSTFGGRIHPITGVYQSAHGAIDIGAAANTPIYAAADGTVVISGWHDSYGNYVKIDHGEGWSTLYAHQTKRNVSVGQTIKQGEVLGFVGTTGSSTGNHLHFEVRYNNERIDPLQFFK